MNYDKAKKESERLNALAADASKALTAVCGKARGPYGEIPSSVKGTPEYKTASEAYRLAASNLRKFNQYYTRKFKAEIALDRAKSNELLQQHKNPTGLLNALNDVYGSDENAQ